jgi:hypothetical protein
VPLAADTFSSLGFGLTQQLRRATARVAPNCSLLNLPHGLRHGLTIRGKQGDIEDVPYVL